MKTTLSSFHVIVPRLQQLARLAMDNGTPLRTWLRTFGLMLGVVFLACSDDDHAERPTGPLLSLQVEALPQEIIAAIRAGEADQFAIADSDSAFAGFFLEGGRVVALTTDPTRTEQIRSAVRRRFSEDPGMRRRPQREVLVRLADYSYRDLNDWRMIAHSTLAGRSDIRSIDLDEVRNRVAVGMASPQAVAEAARALRSAGVPDEAVQFSVRGPFTQDATVRDSIRPLSAGLQSYTVQSNQSQPDICTLGFNATDSGYRNLVLTNSHCTEYGSGGIWGSSSSFPWELRQNTAGVGDVLAYEFLDPGPLFHGLGKDWRVSDAAKFEYEASALPDVAFASVVRTESRHWGWLGQFQSGSLVIDSTNSSFEVVSAFYWPPAGDTVNKIGMGGGWTWGVIESTCESVYYDDYVVLCTHGATYGRQAGDSGAPVFYWSGSGEEVTAYGMHFGADEGEQLSYFNSLSAIEYDLGTTIVYDYTPGALSASISGPSIVDGTSWCQWWTSPSGGSPPYTYHWWGALSGSGSTVSGVVSDNDYLFLTVIDDDGASVNMSHQIAVIDEWDPCDI